MLNLLAPIRFFFQQAFPSLCLAKWSQSTIYLHLSTTHSCHHPPTHSLTGDDAHNTPDKLKARAALLNGEKISECSYCWSMEEGPGYLSDRMIKSTRWWSLLLLWDVISRKQEILPSYIEVAFSSKCQLQCQYCMPQVSSAIYQHLVRHGNYPTQTKWLSLQRPEVRSLKDPDMGAFLAQIKKWRPRLRILRITGGEPLIQSELFDLLKHLENLEGPGLHLYVNTNLSYPKTMLEAFLNQVNKLISKGIVKKFKIYTSLETLDSRLSFTRYGINQQLFESNLHLLTNVYQIECHLMATFNILTIGGFAEFLTWFIGKRQHLKKGKLGLGVSLLKNPSYLSVLSFGKSLRVLMGQLKKDIKVHESSFSRGEWNNIMRVFGAFDSIEKIDKKIDKDDFYLYLREREKRTQCDFFKIFPELRVVFG